MSIPPSITRYKKNGVEYVSSVDRCAYTIRELTRGALRDVGKFIVYAANESAQKLHASLKNRNVKRVKGLKGSFQYWARPKECDLQVGIKHGTWYGTDQELGSSKMKKHGILRNTVYSSIPQIIEIESKYLSALEDEAKALSLISEKEYGGDDD